jgi:lipopolysaccharide export system ATP-binding protein
MAAILHVNDLVKCFGRRRVVDRVSFEIHPGEIVGLLGPNGAGKTTSFRMATGQLTPNEGRVFFNGNEVTELPMYKRARLGMGYLSQEQSIFRRLTVEQNLLAILEMLPRSRSLGRPLTRRERWQRTEGLLQQFGLWHVRKTNSARASGGEKRRLEIARCLACEPLMILLDEPFAAVDPLTKTDIQQIVRGLAASGISILVTDHDVDRVLELAHRIYLITDGKVRCHGSPQEIVRNRIAIDEYLGERYLERDFDAQSIPHDWQPKASSHDATAAGMPRDDRWRGLIEGLMGNEMQFHACAAELVASGVEALPALLDALERPEIEMRRRAFAVLHHLTEGHAVFDPLAKTEVRQVQMAQLRNQLLAYAA